MQNIFSALDLLLDLPYAAFEKKLTKLEEDFRTLSIHDISEEELESYYERMNHEFQLAIGEKSRIYLAIISYISHFDTLIEKYFPDFVTLFEWNIDRPDNDIIAHENYIFLEHLEEILRDYTSRLSDPDQYPTYTNYIQELIQTSMIDLLFWLQDREVLEEKRVLPQDKNTDIHIKSSLETIDPKLKQIRSYIELLNGGVLEKILYDLGYEIQISPLDPDLLLIGRYHRKKAMVTK